jgi:hypothetical protein
MRIVLEYMQCDLCKATSWIPHSTAHAFGWFSGRYRMRGVREYDICPCCITHLIDPDDIQAEIARFRLEDRIG